MKNRCSGLLVAFAAMWLGLGADRSHAEDPAGAFAKPQTFHTELITRGNLQATIRASGTLEPEEVVEVRALVEGTINKLANDSEGKPISFNSEVQAGALLAQIDDKPFVENIEFAKANLVLAEADLAQAKARLDLAVAELKRAQEQLKNKTAAQSDVDVAELKVNDAKAIVASNEAGLALKKVLLKQAVVDLDHTHITSPIKGVIIDLRVNVGGLARIGTDAPALFVVATDLKKMQLRVLIDEAQIAQIHEKQVVHFTTKLRPGKVFDAQVSKIRLNAQMARDVVSYTVEVPVNDARGELIPYLTAAAEFDIGERKNVLLVPTAAIMTLDIASEKPGVKETRRRVWVQDGDSRRVVDIQVGASNRSTTEVTGGDLKEGVKVLIPDAGEWKDAPR